MANVRVFSEKLFGRTKIGWKDLDNGSVFEPGDGFHSNVLKYSDGYAASFVVDGGTPVSREGFKTAEEAKKWIERRWKEWNAGKGFVERTTDAVINWQPSKVLGTSVFRNEHFICNVVPVSGSYRANYNSQHLGSGHQTFSTREEAEKWLSGIYQKYLKEWHADGE